MGIRTSIVGLQDNPSRYIHECKQEPVEITRHGKTVAYIVPPQAVNVQQSYLITATSSLMGVNSNEPKELIVEKNEHSHK